jgi:FlaG/FlaF family flagellin (archaellin)
MKGISTILATILIVIIVVALVSLTYTFAIGLFGTASSGATSGVEQTTIRIDKGVAFVTDPTCTNGATTKLSFTLRHLGATYPINQTEVSVFFGNDKFTIESGSWALGTLLQPGSTVSVVADNTTPITSGRSDMVTVSAPAASITKNNVKC